nr:phosphatidylinositol 4-kinase gamma 7-like isoform X1 [Ipomoea batatas]
MWILGGRKMSRTMEPVYRSHRSGYQVSQICVLSLDDCLWLGPVQTQMAVAVCKSSLGGGYNRNKMMEGKPASWRRVFVQTETGCVVGIELDLSDNVHTVKRRNYSPLLLTWNSLHRSSSTPCLSPTGREIQQRDQSGPIEILSKTSRFAKTKQLVKEIAKAMKAGIEPLPVHGGLGGAYYFRNIRGQNTAIIKPTDEEPFAPNNPNGFVGRTLGQPGLKSSVRVGETGFREVAAYLLDYDHFANVPPTALVKITHSIFNVNDGVKGNKPQNEKQLVSKIASFQQFIPHDFDANDHGTSSFPVASVHRIGILDIRIFNTDRHAGNILVRKLDGAGRFDQVELIPIDHGLCLPESLEDPYFEWIHWPQASIPFSDDELEYIDQLDRLCDSAAYGLCLGEIGKMMSREFHSSEEEPSGLEVLCIQARKLVAEREVFSPKDEVDDEEFQFDIDCEDGHNSTPKLGSLELMTKNHFAFGGGNGAKQGNGFLATASSGIQSANELLSASVSFVKLADMNEEEWAMFLEKFQELLSPAFAKLKSQTLGHRQLQRLGTSCQF